MKEKKCFMQTVVGLALVILLGTAVAAAGVNPLKLSTVGPDLYVITGMEWDVNVTFLVTEDGVLVIDSGNDPAEGRWVVEKIKEKTSQPIKYAVLTHYHPDHSWGLMGFPQNVTVISHAHCAKNFANNCEPALKETVEKWLPQQIRELQAKVAQLKKENNPAAKKEEEQLGKLKQRLEDFKKGQLVYPTITFEDKLTLRMGKETIELIYPGRAHTDGNLLVYMPGRKVIIMGDMLFYGYIPYIDWRAGSDTRNWIEQLEKLSQWEIDKVIPGHGEVTTKVAFEQQGQYLTDLRQRVKEAMAQGLSLEEITKSLDMTDYKHLKFYDFLASNIDAVYHEMKK